MAPTTAHDVTASMEEYLSSTAFEAALRTAYQDARREYGSTDSNVPAGVLQSTCTGVLSRALPSPLDELPAPDTAFIDKAMSSVLPSSMDTGLRSFEEFETAVQVVLLHLAATADRLGEIAAQDPGTPSDSEDDDDWS